MKEQPKEKKRSKKKALIILFSILAVFIIAGAAVAIWQRNNITAARYYIAYTPEEISDKLEENEQRITESIQTHLPVPVTDLTDEEKAMMSDDQITKEEAIQILVDRSKAAESELNGTNAEAPEDPEIPEAPGSVGETEPAVVNEAPASVDKITELVAEIYVLRAYYKNQLEGMRASAIKDFIALSEEQQTDSKKMEIGMNYLNRAGGLESECDGLMNDLVARLKKELENSGGDTSIIKEVMYTYAQEKSLTKAYYLSLYN